jgi:imidazolonepropionase-like amidohydrolase
VIENGSIRVEGGKIAAVGPAAPGGPAAELDAVTITPGLIDLAARIHSGALSAEQSSEITPGVRATDGLDLFSSRWMRAVRGGATSVLVTPFSLNVVGGLGAVVKTAGPRSLEARTLRADACLFASFGQEPSAGNRGSAGKPRDFYTRRPTTRMGVEWTFRKAFYDVLAKDPWPPREVVGRAEIEAVLRGELPLVVQAHTTQDIRTACFLKEEFAIPRMIIEGAAEAWREPALLVRTQAAVVLPPHDFGGRSEERAFFAWKSGRQLAELGVPFAFSGQGSSDFGARLAYQPGYAMRAGLSFEAALEAATLQPARMLGVDDRVGSIEPGKDADLVLWSGEPFELTSRVIGVLVDGRLALDPRLSPSPRSADDA